jgi:hypothetical protein
MIMNNIISYMIINIIILYVTRAVLSLSLSRVGRHRKSETETEKVGRERERERERKRERETSTLQKCPSHERAARAQSRLAMF